MGSVKAIFTWAVPVKVERLGAHLEAYANLQPTLTMLRLCNQFGRGDEAAITRLPVELVKNVEDHLMSEERKKTRKEWTADLRCFENTCEPRDHLSPGYLEALKESIQEFEGELSPFDEEDIHDIDDEDVDLYLDDVQEIWSHKHDERQARWQRRVGVKASEDRGDLGEHSGLVFAHFRLRFWTTHVRVAESDDESQEETTVAYLRMPKVQGFKDQWCTRSDRYQYYGDHHIETESGYGIPVNPPPPPSEKEQASFKRAMKILGLKPYAHASQAAARASSKRGKKVDISWEPQLTLLLKSTTTGGSDF